MTPTLATHSATEYAQLKSTSGAPVPLTSVRFQGSLLGGQARVAVHQRYKNTEASPIEAVYVFPLPSEASLHAFSMTCQGRTLQGVVQEREQAFRTYDDALVAGHGAALLEQERPNVFTANVGNILPGEEVELTIEYLQRLHAEEGFLSWRIPTMVAPRYIPGTPLGPRTGDGSSPPTDRVPDADRITPPVGGASYRLELALTLDLGRALQVESPSHRLDIRSSSGTAVVVGLADETTALDRDLVLNLRSEGEGSFTTLNAHKEDHEPGYFSLTVIPDLLGMGQEPQPNTLVFLVDVSGSMSGQSIVQAKAALQLCLRNLREGDRFNLIAFSSSWRSFQAKPVAFTQESLREADAWVQALVASGGTELLEPLQAGLWQASESLLFLLTDGQVGNEAEILQRFLAHKGQPRVYSFGIGTNVSDALLRDLAKHSGGALEMIYPGERIEDKVLAQLARAIAPRVRGVKLTLEGLELQELTPQVFPDLVDGEPLTLYGRYTQGGTGRATLRGTLSSRPFGLEVPISLPAVASEPALKTLWASEKIRELQALEVSGRRADANRARIIGLATTYAVATPYTSFVVVEQRTGARNVPGIPERRAIPTHIPAGWDMFGKALEKEEARADHLFGSAGMAMAPAPAMAHRALAAASPGSSMAPPPPPPAAPMVHGPMMGGFSNAPVRPAPMMGGFPGAPLAKMESEQESFAEITGSGAIPSLNLMADKDWADAEEMPARATGRSMSSPDDASSSPGEGVFARMKRFMTGGAPAAQKEAAAPAPAKAAAPAQRRMQVETRSEERRREAPMPVAVSIPGGAVTDPVALLKTQLASGLFPAGDSADSSALLRATARALWTLLQAGITSSHALYGGQVKKAVDAILAACDQSASDAAQVPVLKAALGAAYLVSSGRRTRAQLGQHAIRLGLALSDEAALQREVEQLLAG